MLQANDVRDLFEFDHQGSDDSQSGIENRGIRVQSLFLVPQNVRTLDHVGGHSLELCLGRQLDQELESHDLSSNKLK